MKLNIRQIAMRAGVSRNTVHDYLVGRRRTHRRTAERVELAIKQMYPDVVRVHFQATETR